MSKESKNAGAVNVTFAVPAFRYEGVEYKSADVEKAAEEGDEKALEIISALVKMGSGIVQVTQIPVDPNAPDDDDDEDEADLATKNEQLTIALETSEAQVVNYSRVNQTLGIRITELETANTELANTNEALTKELADLKLLMAGPPTPAPVEVSEKGGPEHE